MAQDGSDPRTDENGEALRKLTVRLLTEQNRDGERAAPPPRISVGRLPEDLPGEVTIPFRAGIVGVVERDLGRGIQDTEIVLDVPLPAERFREVYRRQLLAAGWDEDEEFFGRRGFVPPGLPGLFHRAASRSSRLRRYLRGRVPGLRRLFPVVFRSRGTRLMVSAHERPDAPTDVRLRLTTGGREPWLYEDDAWTAIPTLYPPPNIRGRLEEQDTGILFPPPGAEHAGSSGGGRWEPDAAYSYGVVMTELDLNALYDHYANQIRELGWSPREEGVDGHQAWSHWTFTHEQDTWEGTFGALRLAGREGRYSLQIQAARTKKAGE